VDRIEQEVFYKAESLKTQGINSINPLSVGTRLIRAGKDIHAVACLLDHSQVSTTKRYAKHNTESMRAVVQGLEQDNHVFITLRDKKIIGSA